MVVKVGINGFGRIGRLALRRIQTLDNIEVTHVNDLTDSKMLAHLLKYDSTQGKFDGTIDVKEDGFIINNKFIKVTSEPDPEKIDWASSGVDIVLEATGFFAPGGNVVKTVVFNVNHETLTGEETVISPGSCTTNCLAPMADTLNKKFGILVGTMTTIHSYTGDQMTLDAPHRKGDLRRARAAAVNTVPTSSGAAKAIGLVIPELDGLLKGHAQRVATPTGSLTELVSLVKTPVTVEEVNAAMKAAQNESFAYNEDFIVSSDIIGDTHGSIFDATQTEVTTDGQNYLVKTVAWYDNEMSFTAQLIRTLEYFSNISK